MCDEGAPKIPRDHEPTDAEIRSMYARALIIIDEQAREIGDLRSRLRREREQDARDTGAQP